MVLYEGLRCKKNGFLLKTKGDMLEGGWVQEGSKVVTERQFFILPACEDLVCFLSLILDKFILQKNSCFGTAMRSCEQTTMGGYGEGGGLDSKSLEGSTEA